MRKNYGAKALILLAVFAMVLGGCKKEEKMDVTKASTAIEQKTEASNQDPHEGKVKSRLSGKWVDEAVGTQRPIAIMINNIKQAQPQSGISKADIIYECLVEGGITRLMAILENYNGVEKLGSVRSARHYYVEIADEYDAIFAHYGQTKYAVSEIEKRGIDTLSGLSSLGDVIYYRDSNRVAPHNAYIDEKGIEKGIEQMKYRKEYEKGFQGHFRFYDKNTALQGEQANKVTLSYSNYTSPYFIYDSDKKLYKRFQYGEPQIDDQTKEQLTYRNIIVQFVKEWDIDRNGYQTMDLDSSGKGYYITMGQYIPITWEKTKEDGITHYYTEKGLEIRLNIGKTWVSVFPNDRQQGVEFE